MVTKEVKRYLKVWWRLTMNSFKIAFMSRLGALTFTFGKLLRFVIILFFLIVLIDKTKTLAGYTLYEVFVFFFTFNLIDTITQLLFRDVYRFRPKVVSGDFDLILVKPVNPLFRVLLGGADPLDLIAFIPYAGIFIYLVLHLKIATGINIFAYGALFANGMLIAAAFHILVLALGILTAEVDHTIMIYRDLSATMRFPRDIYKEPLKAILTFVIPVGVMVSFPSQALIGALSFPFMIIAFLFGFGFLTSSVFLWRYALKSYTSASS